MSEAPAISATAPALPAPRLRIFRIWPERTRPAWIVAVIAIAYLAIVPCGLFFTIIAALSAFGRNYSPTATAVYASWASPPAMAAAIFAPLVVPWLVRRIVPATRKLRMQRLLQLAEDPRTMQRLPHRIVEYLLTANPYSRRFERAAMLAMKPGQVLVVAAPRQKGRPVMPSIGDDFFEPIELSNISRVFDRMESAERRSEDHDGLTANGTGSGARALIQRVIAAGRRVAISMLRILYWLSLAGIALLLVVLVAGMFYRVATQRASSFEVLLGAAAVIVVLIVSALLTGRGERLYAVPGGIVWRRAPKRGRSSNLARWSAATAALIVDLERDRFVVVAPSGGLRHPFFGRAALAAWTSRARQPTQAEVESYFQ